MLYCRGLAIAYPVDPESVFVQNQTYPSDAALVLGCDDHAKLSGRVRTAVELLAKDQVTLLILSGDGRKRSGRPTSEASRMRSLALDLGANPDKLVLEERSQSTVGNAKESWALIESCPILVGLRSFKIVTSAYHSLRAEIIFRHHFPPTLDLHSHPSAYGITKDNWKLSKKGRELVGDEIRRIKGLVAKGYALPKSFGV